MKKIIFIAFLSILLFSSCENIGSVSEDPIKKLEAPKDEKPVFSGEVEFAQYYWSQMKVQDFESLLPYSYTGGIILSPFINIDEKAYNKFTPNDFQYDKETYFWGMHPASGDSIRMSLSDYLQRYITSFDIMDKRVEAHLFKGSFPTHGTGTTNVSKVFPSSKFVEFYLPPTEEGNLDWKSLIFVVNDNGNHHYSLSAIIDNQWMP